MLQGLDGVEWVLDSWSVLVGRFKDDDGDLAVGRFDSQPAVPVSHGEMYDCVDCHHSHHCASVDFGHHECSPFECMPELVDEDVVLKGGDNAGMGEADFVLAVSVLSDAFELRQVHIARLQVAEDVFDGSS